MWVHEIRAGSAVELAQTKAPIRKVCDEISIGALRVDRPHQFISGLAEGAHWEKNHTTLTELPVIGLLAKCVYVSVC